MASIAIERSNEIARLLRQDDAKFLLQWIREQQSSQQTQLQGVRDPIDMGRCQGRLEILDKILKMKEE